MVVHKKYYKDGELLRLLETKTVLCDGGRIDISFSAEYSSDGFTDVSKEKELYYSEDLLCKTVEIEKKGEEESQKIVIFYKNGNIHSRTFLQTTPFLYSKEFTSYAEDGSLVERETETKETDPTDLVRKERHNLYLTPVGQVKNSHLRRNFYKNGRLWIHYGKDEENNKFLEAYSEYDTDGELVFIEKKEVVRNVLASDQVVEISKTENTNGFSEKNIIYEEIKGKVTERLMLDSEEIEKTVLGDNTVFVTLTRHRNLRRQYKESFHWDDDVRHIESKEMIYRPDGEVLVVKKKYKRTTFNDAGLIDLITTKEVTEEGSKVMQVVTTRDFGNFIGDYSEQIVSLDFLGGKLVSCQIEYYYDPDHLLGYVEKTKEVPSDVYSMKQLHTVKSYVSFGIIKTPVKKFLPFWHKIPHYKKDRMEIRHKEFIEDIFKEMHHFLIEEEHEWVQEVEMDEFIDIEVPEEEPTSDVSFEKPEADP